MCAVGLLLPGEAAGRIVPPADSMGGRVGIVGAGPILAVLIFSAASGAGGAGAASGKSFEAASAADIGSKWGVVTSIKRTPERNRAVGGAPNSFHLAGRAIDIARRPGVRHADIEAAFRKAGYWLIESLDEGDHSHFAFGTFGETPKRSVLVPRVRMASAPASSGACRAKPAEAEAGIGRRRPDRTDDCPAPDAAES